MLKVLDNDSADNEANRTARCLELIRAAKALTGDLLATTRAQHTRGYA